ncbi:hypothetical protein E8E11_010197 [Didymella keratinophila]|nr:hypothetical protein E8E11_010197 [Didymella keratinophila]
MSSEDFFGPHLTGRASSPALSDTSDISTLSRSPSPVPGYQHPLRPADQVLPLTPPNTPGRSRASNRRFTSRNAKRATIPDTSSSSKKLRPQEPSSPGSPTSPRAPRTSRSPRKFFEDAVPSTPSPVLSVKTPWVVGKGGCDTLEVLPKEIRQKIYGLAFGVHNPITIKDCCGLSSTPRERGACRKHGSSVTAEAGRYNVLQVSKAINEEAQWVITTQGRLVLKFGKSLTDYLGSFRWNNQRPTNASKRVSKRKTTMWEAVGKYRHVEVQVPRKAFQGHDPASSLASLVEVAFSLCQSWTTVIPEEIPLRNIKVDLGGLFTWSMPFNVTSDNVSFEMSMWVCRYSPVSRDPPDYTKLAQACGNNLLRLVAAVARYRGLSQWSFVADTQLDDDAEGGLSWLSIFQAECAKYGMLLAHGEYD